MWILSKMRLLNGILEMWLNGEIEDFCLSVYASFFFFWKQKDLLRRLRPRERSRDWPSVFFTISRNFSCTLSSVRPDKFSKMSMQPSSLTSSRVSWVSPFASQASKTLSIGSMEEDWLPDSIKIPKRKQVFMPLLRLQWLQWIVTTQYTVTSAMTPKAFPFSDDYLPRLRFTLVPFQYVYVFV